MSPRLRLALAGAIAASALAAAPARADGGWRPSFFHELYGDLTYTYRYGPSTFDRYRAGLRVGPLDAYGMARFDWADTHASQVPTPYAYSGVVLGGGARVFLFARTLWLGVEAGRGFTGTREGQGDLRAGGAGYWDDDDQRAGSPRRETYADGFYIRTDDAVNDVFLLARHRQGWLLARALGGFAWAYGVAHVNLSGKATYGADNRAEGGVGLGWRATGAWHDAPLMSDTTAGIGLNAELRGGAVLRGDLAGMSRGYVTPFLVVAGGF